MTTTQDIISLLRDGHEPSEPQTTILDYLRAHNGKKLTKRDEARMKKDIAESIELYNTAGMTYVSWGDYRRSGGNKGGALLIAYCDGAPTIDAGWVEEKNGAYFSARVARNEKRSRAMFKPDDCEDLAGAVNSYNQAKATIERLTEYDTDMAPIHYEVQKLIK